MHPNERVEDKPAKEEFQIAKWIRKNVPIKRTKFLNHNVEYFTGKDLLISSETVVSLQKIFKNILLPTIT